MTKVKNLWIRVFARHYIGLAKILFHKLLLTFEIGSLYSKKPQIVLATKHKTIYGDTSAMPVEFPTGFT